MRKKKANNNNVSWAVFVVVSLIMAGNIVFHGWAILSAQSQAVDAYKISALARSKVMTAVTSKKYSKEASLLLVGDIMLSRTVGLLMEKNNDFTFPFVYSMEKLAGADITAGNLEGALSSRGSNQGSKYSFRADPRAIKGLVVSGFDVVSLANNHILDWGTEALSDTKTILADNNIVSVGAGNTVTEANKEAVIERNGLRVAFLSYTNLYPRSLQATATHPGISTFDPSAIEARINNIKERGGADIIVVMLHWGKEYEKHAEEWQKNLAHALIDAGADIIMGSHPHVVQEVERYKRGVIFYSLGNFVFDQYFSPETMSAIVAQVIVGSNGVEHVKTIPVTINKTYQPIIASQW